MRGQGAVRCFVEVKGCATAFDGRFCLSANEARRRQEVAASENKAYVIAVVDHMEELELATRLLPKL